MLLNNQFFCVSFYYGLQAAFTKLNKQTTTFKHCQIICLKAFGVISTYLGELHKKFISDLNKKNK